MSQRQIIQVFEQYQKSRMQFVQTVADLAHRPQNIEILQNTGIITLLHPLMLDVVPSIQQAATMALGHLADGSNNLAQAVVEADILPQLITSLDSQNRFHKKTAAFVLRAVAKHSPELAEAVVSSGGANALVLCLKDFDRGVREAAAWALGNIAQHNESLSQAVVDAGATPLLVLSLQEPEIALKRIAAATLSDICKHTPQLAQTVVDTGAIAHLAQMILHPDATLKRKVFSALSQISKHSYRLAEMVIEADIFPATITCLSDPHDYVKKNVIILMKEVVKHTPELAECIVNCGGLVAVIDYLGICRGHMRLPGILMLGFIAAHSEILAMAIILSKGLAQLALCLSEEAEHHIKAATVWAINQIGQHTPEHAKAVALCGLFPTLLQLYMEGKSEDLQTKCKNALKSILQICTHLPALQSLLYDAPSNILKYVVGQFSNILPHDSNTRRLFVTSGGLKKVQEIDAEPGSQLQEHINAINSCFPEEIVRYHSPGYSQLLLERLESYQPEEEKLPRQPMRTMSPAKVEVPSPENYLKKHTKEPNLPDKAQNAKEGCIHPWRKLAVPPSTEIYPVSIHSKRDMTKNCPLVTEKPTPITVNTHKGHKKVLENSDRVPKQVWKKDLGKAPGYLQRHNAEKQRAQEQYDKLMKEEKEKQALKQLSEKQRQQVLQGLKKKRDNLHQQYQVMSLLPDTFMKHNRKLRLEVAMADLEKEIRKMERFKNIYMVNDRAENRDRNQV